MSNHFQKLVLYYRTVRYLKLKQIFFQIYYRIKKALKKNVNTLDGVIAREICLVPSIHAKPIYKNNSFTFLNKQQVFQENKIDWNFGGYGKLWAYNLNYFDFLNQEELYVDEATMLINSFCNDIHNIKEGIEPYPISLRGINWIKFFSYHRIRNHKFDSILFLHYTTLFRNIEYHLLGNHLIENGFSLLFGAYYFHHEDFYRKARKIIFEQLEEQILSDGAHFELSPMYHQIILFRLLDCVNLCSYNKIFEDDDLLNTLKVYASKMIGWLKTITFENGDIPMVNDSAFNIAPNSKELLDYAKRLGIDSLPAKLSDSGYRKITFGQAELLLDVGQIGPDYIPGHAHSDTFNFILYYKQKPLIVEAGTSTYENNLQRFSERSTAAHNTVMYDDINQSEVWSSFRVGRRAKIIRLTEKTNSIAAAHNAYQHLSVEHERTWLWNNSQLTIRDFLYGKTQRTAHAYFHFHPDIEVSLRNNVLVTDVLKIHFSSPILTVQLEDFDFAAGFYQLVKSKVAKVSFSKELESVITFQN